MPNLLIIDDETSIQHAFRRAFPAPDFHVTSAGSAAEGISALSRIPTDVVVLDVHLPDADGLSAFERIHEFNARLPVILVTGHGTTELAIEAIKRGAFDYLLKPLELPALRTVVARACTASRLMSAPVAPVSNSESNVGSDLLVGKCPGMQAVYKAIGRVAPQNVTVLILGESGTGKELVARAIYQHSSRAQKPFLAINCAAIPEALLESELFGHERGAFTGADRKRLGKFEQCDGGTLFLDEVAEMSPMTQVKTLRILQEQQFERIGGTETVHSDVRLIAATNADLESLVASGRFRQDLFFRLNVFAINLPPLRERGEDISELLEHFISRYARELNKPTPTVSDEALTAILKYKWPGNVRELQSVLKQSLLHVRGAVLLPDDLPDRLHEPNVHPEAASQDDLGRFLDQRLRDGSTTLYQESLDRMERQLLHRVLEETHGNQVHAARILGITRGSLRTKIRSLGIAIDRTIRLDDESE
jgi:two-component system nitrogen regulation response regulator GlnG